MTTATPAAPARARSHHGAGRNSSRPHRRPSWSLGAVPAVVVVLAVFVLPVALLSVRSFTDPEPGLQNFTRLLGQSGYVENIARTLAISATSTALALFTGYPIAYQMAHGRRGVRIFLTVAIMAPYLTSILLRSFSWLVVLGARGPVNELLERFGAGPVQFVFTPLAVVISLTHYLLPLMVLPLAATMRSLDGSRLKAATSLGAGPARAFLRVYLPMTLPGIRAGSVLCFVYGIGAFVIPALLGGSKGSMLGSLIHAAVDQSGDYGLASAASLVLGVLVVAIVLVFQRATGTSAAQLARPGQAHGAGRGSGRTAGRRSRGLVSRGASAVAELLDRSGLSRVRFLAPGTACFLGLLVVLPQIVVVPISFASTKALVFPPVGYSTRWYEEFFTDGWLGPLFVSVRIGLVTAVVATVLGLLAAMAVTRGSSPRWGAATSALMMLPLLFPTVVAAAGLYLLFARFGLLDTEISIVAAHVTIALPFAFSVVAAGLHSLDPVYERAAESLGARKSVQLRRIVAPLLAPSILTGALFAFLTSFDESTIAIFLSGVRVKTLPRRVFEALSLETNPTVAVVSVFVVVCAAVVWLTLLAVRRVARSSGRKSWL